MIAVISMKSQYLSFKIFSMILLLFFQSQFTTDSSILHKIFLSKLIVIFFFIICISNINNCYTKSRLLKYLHLSNTKYDLCITYYII